MEATATKIAQQFAGVPEVSQCSAGQRPHPPTSRPKPVHNFHFNQEVVAGIIKCGGVVAGAGLEPATSRL